MNYTDINIEVMLVAFLAIYTLVKRASRTAMMLYVVVFVLRVVPSPASRHS